MSKLQIQILLAQIDSPLFFEDKPYKTRRNSKKPLAINQYTRPSNSLHHKPLPISTDNKWTNKHWGNQIKIYSDFKNRKRFSGEGSRVGEWRESTRIGRPWGGLFLVVN